jgi:hypothetical protein
VRLTPPAEVIGSLPDGPLRFAGHYEAENMGHRSGSRVKDADAGNGVAWKTPSTRGGDEAAGFVVFGPYVALQPGKYVALFRLKRGSGSGPVATVDVASNGANDTLAERPLSASQLPEGAYRSVAVPFTYTGGALETRVNWAGETPMWIDSVTVYGVK